MAPAVLLLLLLGQEPGYTFLVDGKPEIPESWSLEGSGVLREGDLIRIRGHLLTLGPPGTWKFSTARRDEGLLLLESDSGAATPVAARAFRGIKDGRPVVINPLDTLTPNERRGLRGFSSGVALATLKGIPPSAAVALDSDASGLPPDFSEGLRALSISMKHGAGVPDLKGAPGLRWLLVSGPATAAFDVSALAAVPDLRVLAIRGVRWTGAPPAGLKSLRVLDLQGRGIAELSWASGLKELRGVRLEATGVDDLGPLSDLPKLEWIEAGPASIRSLPEGKLPALRRLQLLATEIADKAIVTFAASHPDCRVLRTFEEAMRRGLEGVDRLVVRSGGTCHRRPDQEKPLIEVKDAAEIVKVVKGIRLDEAAGMFHCMCCGDPTFEFFRAGRLQAVLGFHHGKSLRWPGGWPGDAALSEAGREFLAGWLAERGVAGPKETLEREKREEAARKAKLARSARGLPEAVVRELESAGAGFARALKDHLPEPAARARALYRILGAGNGPWTVYDKLDSAADELLKGHDPAVLQAEAEAALKGEDRIARRGAARFWCALDSPLVGWAPSDLAALRLRVVDLQVEARHPDVRLDGMANLGRWASLLDPKEVRTRVEAAFRDPDAGVRGRAYLVAGECGIRETAAALEGVMAGRVPEPLPLPEIPSEECELASLGGSQKIVPGGPARGSWTETDAAALALGYLGRAESREAIAKLPTSVYTDAALALLGDPSRLTARHFTDAGRQAHEAQLAAVEAVARAKGRWMLREAIGYRQNTFWWEVERVATRLTRMLKEAKAPGSESLPEPARDLEALAAWYGGHGEAFVKSLGK